jgi:integrase
LACSLLLFTGQRRSDVVLLGRQHVRNGHHGPTLRFTQQKNRKRKPVTLEIPIVPELQAILDASHCGDLTFLVTEFGKGFTANGFGNRFRRWCDEAGLHGYQRMIGATKSPGGMSFGSIPSRSPKGYGAKRGGELLGAILPFHMRQERPQGFSARAHLEGCL